MMQETGFQIYLVPASIVTITYLVLSLVMLRYLFKLKDTSVPARMLIYSFTGFTVFLFFNFLNLSMDHTVSIWKETPPFIAFSASMIFFLKFAYVFPHPLKSQQREAKIVSILSVSATSAVALVTVYHVAATVTGTPGVMLPYSFLKGLIAIQCVWGILVFLRRTVLMDRERVHRSSLWSLFKPTGKNARACRTLGLLLCVPLLATLFLLLGNAGLFPVELTRLAVPVAIILFYFNFALVYLNHTRETGTFMVKLVGAALVIVMGFLAIAGYLLYPAWDNQYRYPTMISESKSVHFRPFPGGRGFDVRTMPTRFDPGFTSGKKVQPDDRAQARLKLDFPFPFDGREWDTIYIHKHGSITFGAPMEFFAFRSLYQPGIAPMWLRGTFNPLDPQCGIFYRSEPGTGTLTITWSGLVERKTRKRRTLQLVMSRSGDVVFSYRDIQGCRPALAGLFSGGGNGSAIPVRFGQDLPISSSSPTIVEYFHRHYQQYLHQRMIPLTLTVVLVSLATLMVFPLFFRNNFITPVRELLEGVEQIKKGELSTAVPVRSNDEIGSLTRSFNHMVRSLKEAKDGWRAADKSKGQLLALYHAILNTAAEGILTLDTNGCILSSNESAREMFGYKVGEFIAKPSHLLLEQEEQGLDGGNKMPPMGFLEHFNESGQKNRFGLDREFRGIKKDGSRFPLEFSVSVTETPEEQIFTVILHDLTEHHRMAMEKAKLEEQVHQSHKLETIGTLAGGVAHDFNNMLTPIVGYAELTMESIPTDIEAQAWLRDIINSCNRARNLVTQILTFSRNDQSHFELMAIYPVIKGGLHFLRSTFPATIAFNLGLNPDCGWVFGNRNQLAQVLINLCTNAGQAMPKPGGKLYVDLQPVNTRQASPTPHPALTKEHYVMLRVRDTGCGMDRETSERVFEPFFTTKPVGVGTGLGLSVVHGIVEKHGGAITVDSTPGKGSTFTVYLPSGPEPDSQP
ncbi:MAG: HAMP domain-containing protein [bacterium]|nr:HAMP domain-containing protein [bacterium]